MMKIIILVIFLLTIVIGCKKDLNCDIDYTTDNLYYAENKLNSLQDEIIKLFGEAMKETNLEQKDFFKNYSQKLRNIRSKAKAQLAEVADNFFDTIEANGYGVDDFSRKSSGPCGYFIKLKSGDFVDDEKIFNKTAQEAALRSTGGDFD